MFVVAQWEYFEGSVAEIIVLFVFLTSEVTPVTSWSNHVVLLIESLYLINKHK